MRKVLKYLLDLLFPPRCPICGEILPIGEDCARCKGELEHLELGLEEMYAANAGRHFEHLDGAASVCRYALAARELVHRYKFDGRRALVNEMADRMAVLAREVYDGAELTAVLCVPAYEQENDHGERLARAVAERLGLPFWPDALRKIRKTGKQHELDAAGRSTNLTGAFAAPQRELVRNARLLICDDVITSGATLNECAKTLKMAGAEYVFGLSFAATGREDPAEPDEKGPG